MLYEHKQAAQPGRSICTLAHRLHIVIICVLQLLRGMLREQGCTLHTRAQAYARLHNIIFFVLQLLCGMPFGCQKAAQPCRLDVKGSPTMLFGCQRQPNHAQALTRSHTIIKKFVLCSAVAAGNAA
jgi:hypothetical protein